jgi:hypothetical protein
MEVLDLFVRLQISRHTASVEQKGSPFSVPIQYSGMEKEDFGLEPIQL